MMGILAQALNEDGLPGSGEIGYALPYYSFNHEDGVKYYIKNEDPNRGLRTAYLTETDNHQLQWTAMTIEEAQANDAAAWYLTFTPDNQYYQLRNAASGYYMNYSSGFKTTKVSTGSTLPASTNLHLMRGRVDVSGHRGYYIIHPESSANPPTLTATANGKTASNAWNMATTPHTAVDGLPIDETLEQALASIEQQAKSCTKGKEVDQLIQQARAEGITFLSCAVVTDIEQPFALTFMLENPDFDTDATMGWTSTNGAPGYDAQAAEFYERAVDFYQTLDQMPSGVYQLRANAFQRPGSADDIFARYSAGTATLTSSLFINSTTAPVCHICDDRQPSPLFNDGGWGSDSKMSDGTYVPNCMVGASKYFAKGLYDCGVAAEVAEPGSSVKVGLRISRAPTYYWTMFDHFRLFFYGQNRTLVGIDEVKAAPSQSRAVTIYDLSGRRITAAGQLTRGIYIVNGKKIVVK